MSKTQDELFEAFKANNGTFNENKISGGFLSSGGSSSGGSAMRPEICTYTTPTSHPVNGEPDTMTHTDQA